MRDLYFISRGRYFRVIFCVLLTVIGIGVELEAQVARPHMPRLGVNTAPNARLDGSSKWSYSNGARYDKDTSRGQGAGSILLPNHGSNVVSEQVPVAPGKTYTVSIYILTGGVPPAASTLHVTEYSASGNYLRQVMGSIVGNSGPGKWEEASVIYTASSDAAKMTINIYRYENSTNIER